jgi:multiple sugar transport system substrate-binding protein
MKVWGSLKRVFFLLALTLLLVTPLTGCQASGKAKSSNPTILTLWHNYGGQLKDTMDKMIDEFNETVGAEEGVIISVTSISGSALPAGYYNCISENGHYSGREGPTC